MLSGASHSSKFLVRVAGGFLRELSSSKRKLLAGTLEGGKPDCEKLLASQLDDGSWTGDKDLLLESQVYPAAFGIAIADLYLAR